jgi:dihydrolipoamide dehydrogenase
MPDRFDVAILGAGPAGEHAATALANEGRHVTPGRRVPIDEHCRVAEGVWAAGDCTGQMLFTHLAKYQARIALAGMGGQPRRADYVLLDTVAQFPSYSEAYLSALGALEL